MTDLVFKKTKSMLPYPTSRPRDPLTSYDVYFGGDLIGHVESQFKTVPTGQNQGSNSWRKTWWYWLAGRETGYLNHRQPEEADSKDEAGRLLHEEYTTVRTLALADRIEAALRTVTIRLGPNALAMIERGEPVRLSGAEYTELARAAALAAMSDESKPSCKHCGHDYGEHRRDECLLCGYLFAGQPRHAYEPGED